VKPRSSRARGATLIEAVVAVLVLGLAIPPLIVLFEGVAAQGAAEARRAAALELADAYMEELAARAFEEPSLPSGSFGAEEAARTVFDDVDDYHGLDEAPPRQVDGGVLAQFPAYRVQISVDSVSATDPDPATPAAAGSTALKRIRVRVSWTDAGGGEFSLATLRTRTDRRGGPLREGGA
jgi:MSHA pilin protein MshD